MKVAIITLGCRTNQAESMSLEHALAAEGHQVVDLSGSPDICVINTCTVTSSADQQSRQLIKRAAREGRSVVVTGCYGELNRHELERIPGSIQFVPNNEKQHIINYIKSICSSSAQTVSLPAPIESAASSAKGRQRSIVKVQDGCNYSCSYCAIPLARGRSRSLPLHEIMERIEECELMGYKEVVLTGIHLGTYGMDLTPGSGLAGLVEEILARTGMPRVRLSSLEVREIDERLLDLLQEPRVCNHLHVPLQSGDDNILKSMNRMYTSEEFCRTVEKIISTVPDVGLGTDVIVGFPGEGEAEFHNTRRLIEALPFSYLHVFPYSPRPKTRAASFPGQVPGSRKKERVAILRELGAQKKQEFIAGHMGRIVDFIVEESSGSGWTGTTGNYIKAILTAHEELQPGMVVNGRIAGTKDGRVAADVVSFVKPLQF